MAMRMFDLLGEYRFSVYFGYVGGGGGGASMDGMEQIRVENQWISFD